MEKGCTLLQTFIDAIFSKLDIHSFNWSRRNGLYGRVVHYLSTRNRSQQLGVDRLLFYLCTIHGGSSVATKANPSLLWIRDSSDLQIHVLDSVRNCSLIFLVYQHFASLTLRTQSQTQLGAFYSAQLSLIWSLYVRKTNDEKYQSDTSLHIQLRKFHFIIRRIWEFNFHTFFSFSS